MPSELLTESIITGLFVKGGVLIMAAFVHLHPRAGRHSRTELDLVADPTGLRTAAHKARSPDPPIHLEYSQYGSLHLTMRTIRVCNRAQALSKRIYRCLPTNSLLILA